MFGGTKVVGPMLAASNYVHMISGLSLSLLFPMDCALKS